jgi:hypothetical protein
MKKHPTCLGLTLALPVFLGTVFTQLTALAQNKTVIFSGSQNQADYLRIFNDEPFYINEWQENKAAFNAYNLHAANLEKMDQATIDRIHQKLSNVDRDIAIELQAVVGLDDKNKWNTGPCIKNNTKWDGETEQWAYDCGQYAADLAFDEPIGLKRIKKSGGAQVRYLLLDSAFYDVYNRFYWDANNKPHAYENKLKAASFLKGFTNRMKSNTHFGSSLKTAMISHFKYEYVDGKHGFKNRHDQKTCYNTCTNGRWIDEETMVNFVLGKVPQIDWVFFDASWSSFSVTPNAWERLDKMIYEAAKQASVGMIVHTDGPWGQEQNGHHEVWFGARSSNTCTDGAKSSEQQWYTHTKSYLDLINTGAGKINNYGEIKGVMVATWHKYPMTIFGGGRCGVALEDVLKCAGSVSGKGTSCPDR